MKDVAKKFFRYLRGELNGFYLTKLAYFMNNWVDKYIMPSLYYMKTVQFDPSLMAPEDILNIAKTAGIVQAITKGRMVENTIRMTTSEQKEGNLYSVYGNTLVISHPLEISDRGLYDKKKSDFDFSFWNTDKEDIVENANPMLQATMVPSDRTKWPILGYIAEDSVIYDNEGNLLPREQWLLSKPPVGKAYSEFYGEQFFHLEENFLVDTVIPFDVIYQIFIVVQEVRYNGSNVKSLAMLTKSMVGDVIKLAGHRYDEDNPLYIIWYYKIDKNNIEKPFVDLRINAWLNLIESFFPQIRLEETA